MIILLVLQIFRVNMRVWRRSALPVMMMFLQADQAAFSQ